MFVTFNPNLANNKSFRNNNFSGKKIAFQRINPQDASSCAHNALKLGLRFVSKQEPVNDENLGLLRTAINLAKGETQSRLKQILLNNWGLTA